MRSSREGRIYGVTSETLPVRVMYLIGSLTSGGAERQLVELARNINKRKHEVLIVIYHNSIHYKYILDVEGVNIICMEKTHKGNLLFLWKLVRLIKEKKIDIIHSYLPGANAWARLAGKLSRCEVIISSVRGLKMSRKWYFLERFLKKWTSCVISNSYSGREEYLENVKVPDNEFVRVIQNGIDLDAVVSKSHKPIMGLGSEFCVDENDFVIVHVARITRIKNQMIMLEAIKATKLDRLKVLFVAA